MSQFGQKYYKHYHINHDEVQIVEVSWWTYANKILNFLLKFSLLLLLLYFLLSQGFGCSRNASIPSIATQEQELQKQEAHEKKAQEPKPQNIQDNQEDQTLTLQEKIPRRVLPELSQIVPQEEVTLEQYMYFVNDTQGDYPSYIDPATNRIIKERKPSCNQVECPVVGLTQENKSAYTKWLSNLSSTEYEIEDTVAGFKVNRK